MKPLVPSTLIVAAVGAAFFACDQVAAPSRSSNHIEALDRRALHPARIPGSGRGGPDKLAPFFSSGLLMASGFFERTAPRAARSTPGAPAGSPGRRRLRQASDAPVNQDRAFQPSAQVDIAYNPVDPDNLIAGEIDVRIGYGQGGVGWSTDGGERWSDTLPPFRRKINDPRGQEPTPEDPNRHTILGGPGTDHTYDFATDPTVAFDSRGRAYLGGVAADIDSPASMVFVTQAPASARGASFLALPTRGRELIVVEDSEHTVAHDRPLLAADRYPASPNRDNVYVAWTVFRFGCGPDEAGYCASPIYGSMSTDHGRTWSTPEQVSGRNPALCALGDVFSRNPDDAGACDFSQGAEPEVLPNGDVVIVFHNANAPGINDQQLAVRCRPSGSSPAGTAHLGCAPPVKIGDDIIQGAPTCDFGAGPELCVPGAFVRSNDFPRVAVDTVTGRLFVVWQDYRHGEYDIQISSSTDGGRTWSQSETVNPDTALDHYFPAIDVAELSRGERVGVSYYRTERVPEENVLGGGLFAPCARGGAPPRGVVSCAGVQSGGSDYVLAGGRGLLVPYSFNVVSPLFAPPDGDEIGFLGDTSGLVVSEGTEAHPIWAEARNNAPAGSEVDAATGEEVFTDSVPLPTGRGQVGVGAIGEAARGGRAGDLPLR